MHSNFEIILAPVLVIKLISTAWRKEWNELLLPAVVIVNALLSLIFIESKEAHSISIILKQFFLYVCRSMWLASWALLQCKIPIYRICKMRDISGWSIGHCISVAQTSRIGRNVFQPTTELQGVRFLVHNNTKIVFKFYYFLNVYASTAFGFVYLFELIRYLYVVETYN